MAKGDYNRAVLEFRNAVQLSPNDPEAHYQLALAAFRTLDGSRAVASVSKALELNPKHAGARILQTQLLALGPDASMVQAAEKLAESILGDAPDPIAFDSVALAEIRLGKLDEAEKHLTEAIGRFPEHLSLLSKMISLKLHQKDFAGAEKALRDAVAKAPNTVAPWLALGTLLLIRGDLVAAEEQFRAALRIDPKDPTALFNLAGIQYRFGRRKEAGETLRLLAELPGDDYAALRAVYLFQHGEQQKAIAEFKRLYAKEKDDRQALHYLITAYTLVGRFQEAVDILDQELKKNRSNVDALLLRARIHLHLGNFEEAEADLASALSPKFQSAEAHYLQAALCAARGRTRARKAELVEALTLDPRHSRARIELCQLLLVAKAAGEASALMEETPFDQRYVPAIVVQRNWVRLFRNEYADVEKDLTPLLARERIPDAVLQKAVIAFWRKDFRAANDLASEVLERRPGDVRAMELVVKLHAAQMQVATGIEKLKLHAAAAGKSAQAQYFLGAVLKSVGDINGARAAFENALQVDSRLTRAAVELAVLDLEGGRAGNAPQRLAAAAGKNDAAAVLMLADMDYKAGNLEKALAGYERAAELNNENVTAINNIAFLLTELSRDLNEALRRAQQAKQLDPDNPSVDDTLGWVQYHKGSFQAAAASFQRSVSREPTARRMYHLAMAYFRSGNRKQAVETFERAYKLDPQLPEAVVAASAMK